jgi:hypothetical protein
VVESTQQVDVIKPTWNSNAWYFILVIKHVIEALNPHHFTVLDRFSVEGTQNTLMSYASSILKIIELNVDLAKDYENYFYNKIKVICSFCMHATEKLVSLSHIVYCMK